MADEPLQTIPDPEDEEGGPVKTFLEHLEDLRWVLIKCFVSLMLGMVTCMVAGNYIVKFLEWPLLKSQAGIRLETLGPVGGVTILMKVALYGGVTIALPFILYFVADFVVPALKRHEKKYFKIAFAIGTGLFLAGMCLCYFFILEISLRGLVAFNRWLELDATMWNSADYFSFVIMFMVGMGLSFEVPVLGSHAGANGNHLPRDPRQEPRVPLSSEISWSALSSLRMPSARSSWSSRCRY